MYFNVQGHPERRGAFASASPCPVVGNTETGARTRPGLEAEPDWGLRTRTHGHRHTGPGFAFRPLVQRGVNGQGGAQRVAQPGPGGTSNVSCVTGQHPGDLCAGARGMAPGGP
eukprot:scaffold54966_cov60-Phaeocystis_antarctica.AAC.2